MHIWESKKIRMGAIQKRTHYQLLLPKNVVLFRGIRYVSTAANFELTDINNIIICLGGLINYK